MFLFSKYKINSHLNVSNLLSSQTLIKKNQYLLSYIFNHKNKILRDFIYIYSSFFILNPFSEFKFNINMQYNLNINTSFLNLLEYGFESMYKQIN